MSGNRASDAFDLEPATGPSSFPALTTSQDDGLTFEIPVVPSYTPPPTPQPVPEPEPEPEPPAAAAPEQDIPLDELAAWVETCIEEADRTLEEARGQAEEASAAFELSQDAHIANARKHVTEHAANWAKHITGQCSQAMANPETAPSPREVAA